MDNLCIPNESIFNIRRKGWVEKKKIAMLSPNSSSHCLKGVRYYIGFSFFFFKNVCQYSISKLKIISFYLQVMKASCYFLNQAFQSFIHYLVEINSNVRGKIKNTKKKKWIDSVSFFEWYFNWCYSNSLPQAVCDTRSIFKQSTVVWIEFSCS